jgi:hypothetical protein
MTDLPLILALSIRARLEASARPEVAVGVRNFFREPVDPIGVRSRVLQKVVAEVYRAVKKWPAAARNRLCTLLWEGGKMEEGVLVCHLYRRFAKQCAGPEFRMFERWIDGYVNNWAHCDGVSSWLLAACVANEPALMDKLPRWMREEPLEEARRRGFAAAGSEEGKEHGNDLRDCRHAAQRRRRHGAEGRGLAAEGNLPQPAASSGQPADRLERCAAADAALRLRENDAGRSGQSAGAIVKTHPGKSETGASLVKEVMPSRQRRRTR